MRTRLILEGPDGSGKSTLAKIISGHFGIGVAQGRGPERYPGEINERAREYLDMHGRSSDLFDRHPCVSNEMYRPFTDAGPVDPKLLEEFYHLPSFFIYCQGHVDKLQHTRGEFDTEAHIALVEQNYIDLCEGYDQWALDCAHLIYNYRRTAPGLILKVLEGVLK